MSLVRPWLNLGLSMSPNVVDGESMRVRQRHTGDPLRHSILNIRIGNFRIGNFRDGSSHFSHSQRSNLNPNVGFFPSQPPPCSSPLSHLCCFCRTLLLQVCTHSSSRSSNLHPPTLILLSRAPILQRSMGLKLPPKCLYSAMGARVVVSIHALLVTTSTGLRRRP